MQWDQGLLIKNHKAEIFALFFAVKLAGAGADKVWIF